jgi:hypothetical protein
MNSTKIILYSIKRFTLKENIMWEHSNIRGTIFEHQTGTGPILKTTIRPICPVLKEILQHPLFIHI